MLAAMVGLVLLAGGCVHKPVLELYSARISGAVPLGVTLTMRLRVNNPNAFDVKVRNVRVMVTVAGSYTLPMIRYDPDQWLAASGSTFLDTPVTVPWTMVAPMLAASAGSDVVGYHVQGFVDVTAVRSLGIESKDFEVDEDGSISRAELLVAAGRGALGGS